MIRLGRLPDSNTARKLSASTFSHGLDPLRKSRALNPASLSKLIFNRSNLTGASLTPRSCQQRLDLVAGGTAAVYGKRGAGHETGLIRGEIEDRPGNLLRLRKRMVSISPIKDRN